MKERDVHKEERLQKIELRSEDVQELMGCQLPFVLRYGISFVFIFLCSVFVGSKYVEYPEKINVDVNIESYGRQLKIVIPEGIWVVEKIIPDMENAIRVGDTIMVITFKNDTIVYVSPFDGVAYKSFDYISGDVLVTDNVVFAIQATHNSKNKIRAYSLLDKHTCTKIKMGMQMVINDKNICYNVKEISKIPNMDGLFTVCYDITEPSMQDFILSDSLKGEIIIDKSNVYDRFFIDGMRKTFKL